MNSRSGSAEQLKNMIATCRRAGVQEGPVIFMSASAGGFFLQLDSNLHILVPIG